MIPDSFASRRLAMVLLAIWLSLSVLAKPASALDSPVALAWDPSPNTGILGYNVYRSESVGGFSSSPLNSEPLPSTTFTDLTALRNHTYYYAVTAIADSGLESAPSNTVNVTLSIANQPPLANAGPDQTITLPASANLAASATDDGLPSGALTYSWIAVNGSGVTFAYQAAATQVSFAASGVYTLRVTVTDGQLTSSDDVVVTVRNASTSASSTSQPINLPSTGNPAPTAPAPAVPTTQPANEPTNQAPTVKAGPAQTITPGTRVTVTATAADDGLPTGQLTYQWSVVQGTGVVFTSPKSITTDATFPSAGDYVLRISVNDGVLTSSDNLAVAVHAASNAAPKVSAGPAQSITLPSAASLVAVVTDDGLPFGKLTYEWTVVQGTGVSFTNPRAAATSATFTDPGAYVARVTVSDGQLSSSADVTLNVESLVEVNFLRIRSQSTPSLEMELMDYKRNKTLVSEAVFQSMPSIKSGRLYAVVQDSLNTGVAFSNPNTQPVVINFNFGDETGSALYTGQVTLAPGGKTSTFLSDSPLRPSTPLDMGRIRSFTFSASAPIAAAAVRTMTNQNGDFLFASLPIADLTQPTGPVVLPFYADGAGWQSEIQLVNPTDSNLKGTVQFFPSLNGSGPDFVYDIPARSAVGLRTPGVGSQSRTGWVQVTPAAGTPNPAGSLILSNTLNGVTRSVGTIVSTPAVSSYKVYVSTSGANRGQSGSNETALSIVNPSSTPATVNVELLTMNWQPTGRRGTLTVGPLSNTTLPLNQIPGMAGINTAFEGILQIGGAPVSAAGLLMRYGDLGELVVTTLPAINTSLRSASDSWFLFTAQGGGITTQLKDVHSLGAIQGTSQGTSATQVTSAVQVASAAQVTSDAPVTSVAPVTSPVAGRAKTQIKKGRSRR